MTDRTVLADALESASVEMLREDADYHVEAARILDLFAWPHDPQPNADLAARHRRMAALALAVAEMQERSVQTTDKHPDWYLGIDGSVAWTDEPSPMVAQTLPAALASLLRGAP